MHTTPQLGWHKCCQRWPHAARLLLLLLRPNHPRPEPSEFATRFVIDKHSDDVSRKKATTSTKQGERCSLAVYSYVRFFLSLSLSFSLSLSLSLSLFLSNFRLQSRRRRRRRRRRLRCHAMPITLDDGQHTTTTFPPSHDYFPTTIRF